MPQGMTLPARRAAANDLQRKCVLTGRKRNENGRLSCHAAIRPPLRTRRLAPAPRPRTAALPPPSG